MKTYQIKRLIKSGGQGAVYEILGDDGVTYALKVLVISPDSPDPDEDRRRFEREISLMINLNHPGIVPVTRSAPLNGQPSYIMPWASRSLQQEMDENPWPLEEEHALDIFVAVLDAIEYAHNSNVIHRDIKPANILQIGSSYMVSDFGYSRRLNSDSTVLTRTNAGFGSRGYVAPEQWDNAREADLTADIYSLGALLYALFGGAPGEGIVLEKVSDRFRDVIVRATSRDPRSRYLSVTEMKNAIARRRDDIGETEQAEKAAQRHLANYERGDLAALTEIRTLLLANRSDHELYLSFVSDLPATLLSDLANSSLETFVEILEAYFAATEGQHPFSSTDRYAWFMERVWDSVDDQRVRVMLLQPLLLLGYNHHRFAVRDAFVRISVKAITDGRYIHSLADTLAANPSAAIFVKEMLLAQTMPPVIQGILRDV